MKEFLQHAWEDIKQGESIDVYVSILVAVLLSILNITGIISASLIAPLTLAVLALLAIGILGNRYRLDKLHDHVSQHSETDDILLKNFPDDTEVRLNEASEVWLFGVTFGQFFRENYALLESKLVRGHSLKILLRDPEGATTPLIAKHSYDPVKPDQVKSLICLTLDRLCSLQRVSPDHLEIRVLDHPIPLGGFAFNPEKPNGVLYIQYYPFKMPEGSQPKLIVRPEDDYWYVFFKTQFNILWDSGKSWRCQE
ncbi:MAG: hypothetical protein JSU72_17390 [Deltaproteobacteria bacterium]|nr:MAG: hypothetical protein JSU72_17390 [Deltaproteobacteria bacterium]